MLISETIRKRRSCRSYANRPLEEGVLRQIAKQVDAPHRGPFGHTPRFVMISMTALPPEEWKKLGTYGVIKNANQFIIGKIRGDNRALTDYGYCKEKLVLQMTALGLGTCWLGGTFQFSRFARAVDLKPDEQLPTVTPIGYPAEGKSFTEKMIRLTAGSDHRHPWPEIFFDGDFSRALTPAQAGAYAQALENIRLAPSASNKQPWRILRDRMKNAFHFYLKRSLQYKMMNVASLQDIDLGIAMCHFDLTLAEQGLQGKWQIESPAPEGKSFDYRVSWREAPGELMAHVS